MDSEVTASQRREGRAEHLIRGSASAYAISFFSDGVTIKWWKTVKDFLDESASSESTSGDDLEVEDQEVEVSGQPEQPVLDESIDDLDKFSLINVGSFVAICSEAKTNEQFHLMQVEEKHVAEDRIQDSSGAHCIL